MLVFFIFALHLPGPPAAALWLCFVDLSFCQEHYTLGPVQEFKTINEAVKSRDNENTSGYTFVFLRG